MSGCHLWSGSGAQRRVTDALHALQSKVRTLSSLGQQGSRPTCDTCFAEQSAFVVTFGRAGEDKKFSKLGDVEQTLQGFAGADYDLNVSSCAWLTPWPGCCLAQGWLQLVPPFSLVIAPGQACAAAQLSLPAAVNGACIEVWSRKLQPLQGAVISA